MWKASKNASRIVLYSEEALHSEYNGIHFDPDWDKDEHAVKRMTVHSSYNGAPVKAGDIVWVHRFVSMHQNLDGKLYYANLEQVYCIEDGENLIPVGDWRILKPYEFIKEKKEGFMMSAVINPTIAWDGDKLVIFQLHANKEYYINGKTVFFVNERFIFGEWKGEDIVPKEDYVFIERVNVEKKGFSTKYDIPHYIIKYSAAEDFPPSTRVIFKKKQYNQVIADAAYLHCHKDDIYGTIQ